MSWIALLNIFVFLFGVFASAQEMECKLSSASVAVRTSFHAKAHHSGHCIRHQNPLPEYESTQTNTLDPGSSVALLPVATNALSDVFKKQSPHRFSYVGTSAHVGVPVYKFLAHFLI